MIDIEHIEYKPHQCVDIDGERYWVKANVKLVGKRLTLFGRTFEFYNIEPYEPRERVQKVETTEHSVDLSHSGDAATECDEGGEVCDE